ncbi:MAG: hypothetical protein NVS2B14_08930 [Chamaesiphon sp.]
MSTPSLYLIGFKVDPDKEEPEVYIIYVFGGNDDKPIVFDSQIVFFNNPKLAPKALA